MTAEAFHERRLADLARGEGSHCASATSWPLSGRMHAYRDDLLWDWLNWWRPELCGSKVVGLERLGYPIDRGLVEASRTMHERVVRSVLDREYQADRLGHLDFENAIDYHFATILSDGPRVLDFGAGYGRQSFLWATQNETLTYVAVDGIEGSYLLQDRVLRALPETIYRDYITEPEGFAVGEPVEGERNVFHVPSWRLDLLPDGFFDVILAVQVLQELDGGFVRNLLGEFKRVIAPGGRLYIRDHEHYRPAHRVKIGRRLLADGWRLAFRYPGIDKRDIHGIPRVWRFTGEDTPELLRLRTALKRRLWLAAPWTRYFGDTRRGRHGLLRRGLWHYLRHGRPRADDVLDPFLTL